MTRYLIVFVSDGDFCTEVVQAHSLAEALQTFLDSSMNYDEIYSITTAR